MGPKFPLRAFDALGSSLDVSVIKVPAESLAANGLLDLTTLANNGNGVFLSSYPSLADALTAIGDTPTTLTIDTDADVSAPTTIPATCMLTFVNQAKLVNDGGTVSFEGYGLSTPLAVGYFDGFDAGDVSWTGSVYPNYLSADLWTDTKVNAKLARAVAAMNAKQCTIIVFPGDLDGGCTVTDGLSVYWTRGTYTNSATPGAVGNQFLLENNTRMYGDGIGQTFIHENEDSPRIFYAAPMAVYPFDGFVENLIVEDISFVGNADCPFDSSSSTVLLGNCTNGIVRRCSFHNTHGFAAFVGGFSNSGYQAKNCYIVDNIAAGLGTQYVGTIGGRNVFIQRNIFQVSPPAGAAFAAVIDIEPNADTDGSDNIQITNNIFDGRLADSGWNGITVQQGYSGFVRNIMITDNVIIGGNNSVVSFESTGVNVGTNTVTASSHGYETGAHINVTTDGGGGSLPGGLGSIPFDGYVIRISTNTLRFAATQADAFAGVAIDITSTGSGTYFIVPFRELSNGIQVFTVESAMIDNNLIIGAAQTAFSIQDGWGHTIQNNVIMGCGGGGIKAATIVNVSSSDINSNTVRLSDQLWSQSNEIVEEDTQELTVSTTAGSPIVTTTADRTLPWWYRGQTITINAVDYVILARQGTSLILTSNAASNLSDVTATLQSSSNQYRDNIGQLSLAEGGLSSILNTAEDRLITAEVNDAAYLATVADGIIVYTALTSPRTVTLPDATICNGKEIIIKDGAGAAGTHNITIDGEDAQTIDGAATLVISTNYGKALVKSNGANWITV